MIKVDLSQLLEHSKVPGHFVVVIPDLSQLTLNGGVIPPCPGRQVSGGAPRSSTTTGCLACRHLVLILEPIFEADSLDCSHGFRRGRKARDALEEIRVNLKEGRTSVYDADLKGCFDTIPHDKLMACVRMRVADGGVLDLIRGWLSAPVIKTDEQTGKRPKWLTCIKPGASTSSGSHFGMTATFMGATKPT